MRKKIKLGLISASFVIVSLQLSCKNSTDSHSIHPNETPAEPPPPFEEKPTLNLQNHAGDDSSQNLEAECFQGSQKACDQLGH